MHHASSRDPTHRIPNLDVQVVLRLDFLLDVFVALIVLAVHPSFGVRFVVTKVFASLKLRKREKKNLSFDRMCKQLVTVHLTAKPVSRLAHRR